MVACMKIDAFESHEASVSRLRFGPRVYLTKRPADLLAIGPRLRFDRNFHVLCLMRDPRDVIVSRHGQDRTLYWTSLRPWKQRLPTVRRLIGHERFTVVRYEDLVHDPDAIEWRLRKRLPFLESSRSFHEFATVARPSPKALEALGPVRPFAEDRIGNWRNHLPRVAGQLEQYGSITDELIEFGYERDGTWLSMLDGISPDHTTGRRSLRSMSRLRRRLERAVLPWVSILALGAVRSAGIRIA